MQRFSVLIVMLVGCSQQATNKPAPPVKEEPVQAAKGTESVGNLLTGFEPDADRLAVIRECMESYGVGSATAEWPNNLISKQAVVYGSGRIARKGETVRHAVDPAELALCRRLSAEAAQLMAGVEVGMGSESGDEFKGFFVAANSDEPAPTKVTEELIRTTFGGTLFPPVNITVEPLTESGVWWSEVKEDGSESPPEYFQPWRKMMAWFRERPEFVATCFVRIGDDKLWDLPPKSLPPGTEVTGCVRPRLVLGLTRGGSLIGLFGYSVQT
jgi:hypothetical protein